MSDTQTPTVKNPSPTADVSPLNWLSSHHDPSPSGHWDEWMDPSTGRPRPVWQAFFKAVGATGIPDLSARQQRLVKQLQDNGVTYNVYADNQSAQRPWSLNLLPMILTPEDWSGIETGILQRVSLLNRVMADIYGPQTLLRDGFVPAALIHGHPGYLRSMHGTQPLGQTWLHCAAFDLARGPDGQWRVVSHRTQSASGLGYLLENRIAIAQQFPKAFASLKVQRLAASYQAFMAGIAQLSPKGAQARIALLTPGPYNETYFEHAYLAKYLGLPLVEGSDLTVRQEQVFLKTINGLEPVDVLISRLHDEWLDPLELRADSMLGVPGLLQAVRAGHVLLCNPPGAGLLESSAWHGFLPAIAQHWLGEPLKLPSLDTWWCGEDAALPDALEHWQHCLIKPTYPNGHATMVGPQLGVPQAQAMLKRVQSQPDAHTFQTYVPLSQQPSWYKDRLTPRGAILRVFALCDGAQSWRVLPGGLVRLAPAGQAVANLQRGGSSADAWVMTHGDVDETSLLSAAPSTLTLAQQRRPVTSRAAENLFWLGRYTERAENAVRLAQIALPLLADASTSPAVLAWLVSCAQYHGLAQEDPKPVPLHRQAWLRHLLDQLEAKPGTFGVGYNLQAMQRTAGHVRERLSRELRALIDQSHHDFHRHAHKWNDASDYAVSHAIDALDHASQSLAAITGMQTDRMVRDNGWRMPSIGRHLERAATLAHALNSALTHGVLDELNGFEAVLSLFDSAITFHGHYQQRRDRIALADILITHRDNPRSLGWVISTLRSRLAKLPNTDGIHQHTDSPPVSAMLPDPNTWVLSSLQDDTHLRALLQSCEDGAYTVSDAIGQHFFSHAHAQIQRVSA